jgi:hypothetical protein
MSKFLGHLVQRRGYKGTFVPAGEPIPLMNGRCTVTPIYDGPQDVTASVAADKLRLAKEALEKAYRAWFVEAGESVAVLECVGPILAALNEGGTE